MLLDWYPELYFQKMILEPKRLKSGLGGAGQALHQNSEKAASCLFRVMFGGRKTQGEFCVDFSYLGLSEFQGLGRAPNRSPVIDWFLVGNGGMDPYE